MVKLLKISAFLSFFLMVSLCSARVGLAHGETSDADAWIELQAQNNLFALQDRIANEFVGSDGVNALAIAYVAAFSRDFETARQNIDFAKRFAEARGDIAFSRKILEVELVLMREWGRHDALALAHQKRGDAASAELAEYRATHLMSSFVPAGALVLPNISPDDRRIIIEAKLGGIPGTLLFDTGAENMLLSRTYADKYGAEGSGLTYRSVGVDGARRAELAQLNVLEIGTMHFGNVPVGVREHTDGVIGFFLEEGATGILGFPVLARLGQIDFTVENDRVEAVTLHRADRFLPPRQRPNLMLRADKPLIEVEIAGDLYSCIFDTGAPYSLFSETVLKRYQATLDLKLLSFEEKREAGFGKKADYVKALPVRAGHRQLMLQSVQVYKDRSAHTDFCVIGLDAVIQSGGARLDLEHLQITFGPNGRAVKQAFSLR